MITNGTSWTVVGNLTSGAGGWYNDGDVDSLGRTAGWAGNVSWTAASHQLVGAAGTIAKVRYRLLFLCN